LTRSEHKRSREKINARGSSTPHIREPKGQSEKETMKDEP
jgi:hypothetical protein